MANDRTLVRGRRLTPRDPSPGGGARFLGRWVGWIGARRRPPLRSPLRWSRCCCSRLELVVSLAAPVPVSPLRSRLEFDAGNLAADVRPPVRNVVEVFKDPTLINALLAARTRETPLIIGVEGASGSGKTSLAKLVATEPAQIISTDAYYETGVKGQKYLDGIKLETLSEDLRQSISAYERVVVEGICLRDTLAKVGVSPNLFIYCKRISSAGIWNDDPQFHSPIPEVARFAQALIDSWSHQYHVESEPHLVADIVYEWREGG